MGSKKEIQEIREYLSILLSEPIKIPTSEKIEQIPAPEASNRKKDLLEKMKDEDKKAIAKAAASFSTWKNSAFFVVLMILVMLLMMYPMFTGPNYEALDNYIVYDEQFSGNQASSVELDGMQRIKIRILVDEFDKETNSLQVRFIDAENDINQNYRYFSSRHNYIDSDDDQTLYTKTNATIDIRGDVNVRIIIYGRLVFPTGLVSPFLFYGIVVGLAAFMLVFSTRNPYNNSDQHPYLDKLINEKFAENDLPISSFGINILVSTLVLFGILLSIYCILDSTNAAMLEQFLSNTDIINSSSVWLFIASSAFAAYDIASKKSESFSMLRGIIYIFVLTLIFQIIILGTHFITWIRYFTV